mmetsp:Transcript_2210/g.6173  ORF Transcript_2210/g.6173 Transcript_2210/m.6173 type:complete len:170 (-) Transcript_2210:29-538(-)
MPAGSISEVAAGPPPGEWRVEGSIYLPTPDLGREEQEESHDIGLADAMTEEELRSLNLDVRAEEYRAFMVKPVDRSLLKDPRFWGLVYKIEPDVDFTLFDLAKTAWSCATLCVRNDPLLDAIALPSMAHMDYVGKDPGAEEVVSRVLTKMAWSFAELRYQNAPWLDAHS